VKKLQQFGFVLSIMSADDEIEDDIITTSLDELLAHQSPAQEQLYGEERKQHFVNVRKKCKRACLLEYEDIYSCREYRGNDKRLIAKTFFDLGSSLVASSDVVLVTPTLVPNALAIDVAAFVHAKKGRVSLVLDKVASAVSRCALAG
jgi:hypothetical protein